MPIQVRPVAGEGAESYIRRLARTNHLKPSYLRRYLATPQESYGPIEPDQLAALAGRSLSALLHACPTLPGDHGGTALAAKPKTRSAGTRHKKRTLFAAIRQDAAAGLAQRAIERKHHVGRRTVVTALASQTPPPRKKINRRPAVLHGLHHHIDAMLKKNPAVAVKDVWAHLVDDHNTTVSYGAVRAYVTAREEHLREEWH